jgi:hypothetical protein
MSRLEQLVGGGKPSQACTYNYYLFLLSPSFKALCDAILYNVDILLDRMFGLHNASKEKVDVSYPISIRFSITYFVLDEANSDVYNRRR